MARSTRSWSFTSWTWLAVGALIGGLLSLENGQSFPLWMLAVYLALMVGGATELVLAHRSSSAKRYAAATIGLAVLALGAGIFVSAQPTRPVTVTATIANIEWTYSKGSGNHYELTATDGSFYELVPSDFSPQLPGGLDAPSLRGQQVQLTLDEGTAQVLAMTLNDTYYTTGALDDRSARQFRGRLVGGIIGVVGGISLAISVRRLRQ